MGWSDYSHPSVPTQALAMSPSKIAVLRLDASSTLLLNWREMFSTCHGRVIKAYVFGYAVHAKHPKQEFVVWKHLAKLRSFAQQCNFHVVKNCDVAMLSAAAVNDLGCGVETQGRTQDAVTKMVA